MILLIFIEKGIKYTRFWSHLTQNFEINYQPLLLYNLKNDYW